MTHDEVSGDHTIASGLANDPLPTSATTYEPPKLQDLGSVAELTRGVNMLSTDGLASGSAL